VNVQRGFFRSVDNTLIWDGNTLNELKDIEPGSRGSVAFDFASLPIEQLNAMGISRPELLIEASFTGTRVIDGKPGAVLVTKSDKTLRVNSKLHLATRAVHNVGPFTNFGPLPPKVGSETSYTVIWSVANTTNELDNLILKTTLPSYISWKGLSSPNSENVNYNFVNGELTWNVGRVAVNPSGAPVKELSMQVGLTPSASQIGTKPSLTGAVSFSALDSFSGTRVSGSVQGVDTRIVTDPTFSESLANVVP